MKVLAIPFLLSSVLAAGQTIPGEKWYARSSGKLTMLANGLGEDRLGSAKAGYIDTGILLQITDSVKDNYLATLSKQHTAWINKADLRADVNFKTKPFYLTNSVSVKGDDVYDYVNINLDEKLPYKSWMEVDPAKIFIDVYGVQSNTNWITVLRSAKEIKNVTLTQHEDDVVRVVIELSHNQHWGYSINYKKNILSVRVRRQPVALKVNQMLIAIDAGHGGSNNGADGVTSKVLEKNYTIRFANELEKYLKRKGAKVIMTRTSDTSFNNVDRVVMLQNTMPDLMVSLHLNSSSNEKVKGVSTYYKHIGYRSFTNSILSRMLQLDLSEFGNVGNFNFTLNAPTDFPGALVEIGFLSNVDDEKKILDSRFQKEVAKKIYKGIKDWLKSIRKSA
ncbi:MAG: N-acetylmuramoyl-L-alanine amidase [Bacteroidota bacterium]|nr:N-acetylmuramoyl-L-alanine amidase [Bacteroidota bacterium]